MFVKNMVNRGFLKKGAEHSATSFSTRGCFVALFLGVILGFPTSPVAAREPDGTSVAEIEILQRRLTDAGCYEGIIDGVRSAAFNAAVERCPDQDPLLRIEAGMHTGPINRIAVDAKCDLIATGSDDKTVRLWSLPEGRLQRTIRLPISGVNGGKVFAVALSADRRWLAIGRQDGYRLDRGPETALYIYDITTIDQPKIIRRVEFGSRITAIEFSPDTSRIAVGFKGSKGIGVKPGAQGLRVFDRVTGQELLADRDYDGDLYGIAFAPNGVFFTTSGDGSVRRYEPDLRSHIKVKTTEGQEPRGISIDIYNKRLIVGYLDTRNISIYNIINLQQLSNITNSDLIYGNLMNVAWNPIAMFLTAGGSADRKIANKSYSILRRYGLSLGPSKADTAVSSDTVTDLKSCLSGIAYGAADPVFGLINPDGTARILQTPVTADMRDKRADAFTVSADGSSIRFGLDIGEERPVLFDLTGGTLAESPNRIGRLAAPETGSMPISDWINRSDPKFTGQKIALEEYELSRSLAIRHDRVGFVLGTDWYLRSYDGQGNERWKRTTSGAALGVNLADDGRIIIVAEGGGIIRWYRWEDGQELLALFVHAHSTRWIAWTPSGYYMASPGAEDLIGWQINRGWSQEPDFFPASRFRDKFDRPDIVRRVLKTRDESQAVKQANAAAERVDDTNPITSRLPPVLTILTPADGSHVAAGLLEIRYRIRSPSGVNIDRVDVLIDGGKINTRGANRSAEFDLIGSDTVAGSVTLLMPDHDAVVSLIPYAGGRAGDPVSLRLKGGPVIVIASADAALLADTLKPTLYALLIGVSHYDRPDFELAYASKDAVDFAETLKAQQGGLYKDVQIKLLIDKDATSISVKQGLLWLQKQTTSRDLAIVFAAGHGTTDAKGHFWFLTSDADPNNLLVSALSQADIADILFDLPGKKILFLDACHAGAALNAGHRSAEGTDISAAVNDFTQAQGGVVAYAASTGREFSFERDEWGHGAFTKALIEGIGQGKADLLHNGFITTATLDAFLENRVKELTGGQQHPVMTRPTTVPDFPLALEK